MPFLARWPGDEESYAPVKANLFQQRVNAELHREPMEMPRISGA